MNSKPKISVIIPTYNYGEYVSEALDSVLAQTYKDYEIIVIDDGSTDNTKDIVGKYIENSIGNIKYIYQENKGVSNARNTGIKNARGEYIAFLDADDIWFPDKLELQMDLFEKNPELGLVFCNTFSFNEHSSSKKTGFQLNPAGEPAKILQSLVIRNRISTNTVIVKKRYFDKTGLFDEDLRFGEDYDMWLRIAKYYKVDYLNTVLTKYRLHVNNLSKINKEKEERVIIDMIKIRKRALQENPEIFKNMNSRTSNECYYQLYLNLANFYLSFGINDKARRNILQYIRFYPYNLTPYLLFLISFMPAGITKLVWKLKKRVKWLILLVRNVKKYR